MKSVHEKLNEMTISTPKMISIQSTRLDGIQFHELIGKLRRNQASKYFDNFFAHNAFHTTT